MKFRYLKKEERGNYGKNICTQTEGGIYFTEGIPFEIKINHPAYFKMEAIREVEATMAFEGMELTEEDVRMLYAYKSREVSGDELRLQILSEGK